mmetsp:Transcript_20713/g.42280  ORF Transcript_20713/g.42280 Transcript_20713/m.42280 type:complete len:295 (-) Transcript_20713:32-916(-)
MTFLGAHTRTELAEALGVPTGALDYVSLLEDKCCKKGGCSFPPANRNYGKCVCHGKSWYPRKVNADGSDAKYRRGHFLLGSKFQREHEGVAMPCCCCSDKTCEGIGYSHEGMMRVPSDEDADAGAFLSVLPGMTEDRKKQIMADRVNYFVAPWHFHPKHRYMKDGKWQLRKWDRYVDADGKIFDAAPPNYLPQSYIDFEVKSPQLGRERTCVLNAEVENELPAYPENLGFPGKGKRPIVRVSCPFHFHFAAPSGRSTLVRSAHVNLTCAVSFSFFFLMLHTMVMVSWFQGSMHR